MFTKRSDKLVVAEDIWMSQLFVKLFNKHTECFKNANHLCRELQKIMKLIFTVK